MVVVVVFLGGWGKFRNTIRVPISLDPNLAFLVRL